MKVADLVLRLQQLRPDAEVKAFDPDTDQLEPVTGMIFDKHLVELCTDDMITLAVTPESAEKRARRLGGLLDQIEQHLLGAPREVLTADILAIHATLQRMAWPGERPVLAAEPAAPCPATGMKPDACSDRSHCLEACGPHGQISAAVATLHAPNGAVHACERHASTARLQASFLGTHAYVDVATAGTLCTYCATRAAG